MTDGVAVTPGVGATIATDEIAGLGHVQYVKIGLGNDGELSPLLRGQLSLAQSISIGLASDHPALSVEGTVTVSGITVVSGAVSITGTATVAGAVTVTSGSVAITSSALPTNAVQETGGILQKLYLESREFFAEVLEDLNALQEPADRAVVWTVPQPTTMRPVQTVITSSTSAQLALGARRERKGATFYNNSTAVCYLLLGTGLSASFFTVAMAAGSYYELPYGYAGPVEVGWVSANGNMQITEIF